MKRNYQVSALEEDILTLLLGQELYGAQMIEAINNVTQGGRRIAVGSLYPTLTRMENKGYVTSRMDDKNVPERGGARRKFYKITALGSLALGETQLRRQELSKWHLQPGV